MSRTVLSGFKRIARARFAKSPPAIAMNALLRAMEILTWSGELSVPESRLASRYLRSLFEKQVPGRDRPTKKRAKKKKKTTKRKKTVRRRNSGGTTTMLRRLGWTKG